MNSTDFEALAKEIGRGADVDQEELAEALCYAGTAWYEIQQLTKSLCAGYRALQKDCERKDKKIALANKMLTAVRAENKRLREEIAKYRGAGMADVVIGHYGTKEGGGDADADAEVLRSFKEAQDGTV